MAQPRNSKRPRATTDGPPSARGGAKTADPPSARGAPKTKSAVGELRIQLDELGAQIGATRGQLAQERIERAADADAIAEMLVRVSETELALAAAVARAIDAEERARVATGALEGAEATAEAERAEAADLLEELRADRVTLREQHVAVEAAARAHALAREERERLLARIAELEPSAAELARFRVERTGLEVALESARREVVARKAAADAALAAALGELEAERTQSRAAEERARGEFDAIRSEAAALEAAKAGAEATLAAAQRELEAQRTALGAAKAGAEATLAAALGELEAERTQSRAAEERAREQIDAIRSESLALGAAKAEAEVALLAAREAAARDGQVTQDLELAMGVATEELRFLRTQRGEWEAVVPKLESASAQAASFKVKLSMREAALVKAVAELEDLKLATTEQARELGAALEQAQRERAEQAGANARLVAELASRRAAVDAAGKVLRTATAPMAKIEDTLVDLARRQAESAALYAASKSMATKLRVELAELARLLAASAAGDE